MQAIFKEASYYLCKDLAYNALKLYPNSSSVPLSFKHCKDVDTQLLDALLSRQISAGIVHLYQ